MGPTWVLLAPDGPHVGPMNLAIREYLAPMDGRWRSFFEYVVFFLIQVWSIFHLCHICAMCSIVLCHEDVIKWKHFPRYWPFVRGIHRSLVNSPHKGQWRRALMFSLICAWINGWVNNREAGDLRRNCTHYDVTIMLRQIITRPDSGPLFTKRTDVLP